MLRKHFFSIVLVIACLVMSLIVANTAIAGEKEKSLLKSLERIKAYTESSVDLNKYSELLADAKTEFNIYKRSHKDLLENGLIMKKDPISQFMRAVRDCLFYYNAAKGSLEDKGLTETSRYRQLREKADEAEQMAQENWKSAAKHLDKAYELEEKIK